MKRFSPPEGGQRKLKYDNGFPSTGVNAWAREKGQNWKTSLGIPIRQLVCNSERNALGFVTDIAQSKNALLPPPYYLIITHFGKACWNFFPPSGVQLVPPRYNV
jgi:hypothetical protein